MGEGAEMVLDGDACEWCGVYIGGGNGHPRKCGRCRREATATEHAKTLEHHQQIKKVPCPTCGRKVKAIGLADHIRDSHPASEIGRATNEETKS